MFPIEFPFECLEREVVWAIIDNGDKENQKGNYKITLEGMGFKWLDGIISNNKKNNEDIVAIYKKW